MTLELKFLNALILKTKSSTIAQILKIYEIENFFLNKCYTSEQKEPQQAHPAQFPV